MLSSTDASLGLLLVSTLLLFFPAGSSAQVVFEIHAQYQPGGQANRITDIVTADFDADGIVDIAVSQVVLAVGSAPFVSVLRGSGGGFFEPPVGVTGVDSQSFTLGVADFNGDGVPDLAVGQIGSDALVVLGTGGGDFAVPIALMTSDDDQYALASGDFDEDGNTDLALALLDVDAVETFLGDGTGGFAPGVLFGALPVILGMQVGDFDEDGHQDIAVSSAASPYQIQVYAGDGMDGFALLFDEVTAIAVQRLLATDVNQDGHLDLVGPGSVPGDFDDDLLIYPGDGAGGFGPSQAIDLLPACGSFSAVAEDFDQDGNLDLAMASQCGNAIVILGDGNGGFGASAVFPVSGDQLAIASADFDGDGAVDLAIGSFFGNQVTILRNATFDINFVRGDVDADGAALLNDVVQILRLLFNGAPIACDDAADIDDDGAQALTDPLLLLEYLFNMGPPPTAPWPECDPDPTESDAFGCVGPYPACP